MIDSKKTSRAKKKQMETEIKAILKRPYERVLIPDEDTHTFTCLITESPGCIAQGDSVEGTYASLERTAESWLEGVSRPGRRFQSR